MLVGRENDMRYELVLLRRVVVSTVTGGGLRFQAKLQLLVKPLELWALRVDIMCRESTLHVIAASLADDSSAMMTDSISMPLRHQCLPRLLMMLG